jgi:pyruvate kinase
VDLPVLGEQDIRDVQQFACRHGMDFVAASFVQVRGDMPCSWLPCVSGIPQRPGHPTPAPAAPRPPQTADDVRFIRSVLDQAGGEHIKIISKIESQAGLQHYDSILEVGRRLGWGLGMRSVPAPALWQCAGSGLAGDGALALAMCSPRPCAAALPRRRAGD